MKYLLLCLLFFPLSASAQDLKASIMACESHNNPQAINYQDAKINGTPSVGLYQFNYKTWLKFAVIYKVISEEVADTLTYKTTLPYLYNPVYNAAVAHGMIDSGLLSHWKLCSRQLGVSSG